MVTKTTIANMALGHLGNNKEIGNIDTDPSAEAIAVRRFYDIALDETLREFSWPFATKIADLGLVEEDPEGEEWGFSYTYPSDCLEFRRILSGTRVDTNSSKVPYKIFYGASSTVIYTDKHEAAAEYTVRVTDPLRYPPDFVMAFSFLLASMIAPKITAGDPFKVGQRAIQLYGFYIEKAKAKSKNEEQHDQRPDAEVIQARN